MARNSIKSFCKIFSLTNTQSSSVEFRNTNGSAIACNYFRLDSRSTGNQDMGWFHVYPNGVYNVAVDLTSTSGSPTAAGAPGLAGVADGSVEYVVPQGSTYLVSSVTVVNQLGDTGSFALMYGVMSSSSEVADYAIRKLNAGKEI